MKRRFLTGVVAMGLVFSMSVPAHASSTSIISESNNVVEVTQNTVASWSDLNSSHWAYKNIMTMVNKGVISGVSTPVNGVGKYDPTGTVTLGQFLAISTRLVANDKIVKGDYAHWATANYNAAIQANLIRSSDFEGSPLALNANLSREDMAYILVNIAKANGEDLKIKDGIQNNIKDYNSISPNRQNVVLQAYSNGLLAGDTQGKFNPHKVLNRAEVAAVFCRVMNYSARPEVKVNQPSENVSIGYVVTEAGKTQGMLRPAYSRQYDLEALQGVRTGSDSKGVYVTFTAPQLPNELKNDFSFNFTADGYKSNGNYMDAGIIDITLKSGETKKVYFEAYNGGGITSSQIGSMYVAVDISSNSYNYMMIHRVDSTNKTKALEQWYDSREKVVDFNSSAIFSGIGK